jgi:hypothetical protein
MPAIIGASRRPLVDILEGDKVEQDKVMKFFATQQEIWRVAEPTYVQIPKPPGTAD